MKDVLLHALRSSEFWAAVALAIVEVTHEPVPGGDTTKLVTVLYCVFRVVSKVAGFVFPNPSSPTGGWLKNDAAPPAAPKPENGG